MPERNEQVVKQEKPGEAPREWALQGFWRKLTKERLISKERLPQLLLVSVIAGLVLGAFISVAFSWVQLLTLLLLDTLTVYLLGLDSNEHGILKTLAIPLPFLGEGYHLNVFVFTAGFLISVLGEAALYGALGVFLGPLAMFGPPLLIAFSLALAQDVLSLIPFLKDYDAVKGAKEIFRDLGNNIFAWLKLLGSGSTQEGQQELNNQGRYSSIVHVVVQQFTCNKEIPGKNNNNEEKVELGVSNNEPGNNEQSGPNSYTPQN